MKTKFAASALIVGCGLIAAELAAALRSGDIIANGEIGLKLNELYPNRYAAGDQMDRSSMSTKYQSSSASSNQ